MTVIPRRAPRASYAGRHAHHDGGARETGPPAFVPPGGTLLRKLLHNDIRRETSLILQCVTALLDADDEDD